MNPFVQTSDSPTKAAKKMFKNSLTHLVKFESLGAHTEQILSK